MWILNRIILIVILWNCAAPVGRQLTAAAAVTDQYDASDANLAADAGFSWRAIEVRGAANLSPLSCHNFVSNI